MKPHELVQKGVGIYSDERGVDCLPKTVRDLARCSKPAAIGNLTGNGISDTDYNKPNDRGRCGFQLFAPKPGDAKPAC